jgi:hypothetical protein
LQNNATLLAKLFFTGKIFVAAAAAAAVARDEVTNLFWLGICQLRFRLNQ